ADNKSGSLWNINKIDLRQSFDFKFNVNLGCHDIPGADGIVFVLQPISTSVGTTGEGLGFLGITPSVGITIDTYQNANRNDPVYDHIAIHKNGDVNNGSANSLALPMAALASGGNIEDCHFHTFRITWDATAKHLQTAIDGVNRVEATTDMVNDIFGGDPMVFWGFTGATGGESNVQRVCTSLNPAFFLPDYQKTCYPEPIKFIDSSHSFGSIVKWFWDFGDGTIDSVPNPAPHVFPRPGSYDVKLNILGNNGCLSDTFTKNIVAGSKPTAAFTHTPSLICEGAPVQFHDASAVEYGTIDHWSWNIGASHFIERDPSLALPLGVSPLTLTVSTKEGCVSDQLSSSVNALPSPAADFEFTESCLADPSYFSALNETPGIAIKQWRWNFADGAADSLRTLEGNTPSVQRIFPSEGRYAVSLYAIAQNGCLSAPAEHEINIYGTRAFAGNDTLVAENQPLQLTGSGGIFYKWSPAEGLSADDIANPIAVLQKNARYVLTASSPVGCPTTDTVSIKVYKGPAFYVPSAFSPNNDGKNDRFTFIAVGMSSIDLFQVYNRYGQLIYSSAVASQGWDGTVHGAVQPSGTYVWMIRGKDYLGAVQFKKGTVTLVR
ncbi:MAG: PKD domain-containing protein, partial [Flavitalea sp.]